MVATSPNISVFVSPETAGRYFCKAHVPGFPLLTGSANIYIRGPPSIVSQRIQYVPDEGVVKVIFIPQNFRIFPSRLSPLRDRKI